MKTKRFKYYRCFLNFSFIQIKKSFFIIFFFIFSFLSSIATILTLKFLNLNLNDYSLLIIGIPLLFDLLLIIGIVFKLFSENKTNYVDYEMSIKPVSRWLIILVRLSLILYILMIQITLINISETCLFIHFKYPTLLNACLLSNCFITPFVCLFFSFLAIIFAIYFKKITALILMILLPILWIFPSFVTRFLIKNDDVLIQYNGNQNLDIENQDLDNQQKNFSKISFSNETYFLVNNDHDMSPQQMLGKTKFQEYFIFSEWIFSLYSSMFNNFNFISLNPNIKNNPYDLLKNSFYAANYQIIENAWNENKWNQVYVYRPNDLIISNLSSNDLTNLIVDNLKEIIELHPKILRNKEQITFFIEKIKNNPNWNEFYFNKEEIEILKDLLGINTKYNSLFYFFKYYDNLINNTFNFKNTIIENTSFSFYNLMNFLWTSFQTKFNFSQNNVLDTKHPIKYYYPDVLVVNNSYPILSIDRQNLFKMFYIDNKSFNIYAWDLNSNHFSISVTNNFNEFNKNKKIINNGGPITNLIDFRNFINKLSLNYGLTLEFINSLPKTISKINLSNNYLNLFIYAICQSKQQPFLSISNIIILIYSILLFGLAIWTFNAYSKKNFN